MIAARALRYATGLDRLLEFFGRDMGLDCAVAGHVRFSGGTVRLQCRSQSPTGQSRGVQFDSPAEAQAA